MRNYKKHFFETLIRLTILANVFRINNQYLDLVNSRFNTNNYNFIFVAPSLFNTTNPSHKDLISPTESRFLVLNSIEFNSKEDIEMEIDIQKILEQDIDLGVKNIDYDFRCYQKRENGSCSSSSPSCSSDFDLDFNEFFPDQDKQDLSSQQLESQKNADILATQVLFENQPIPDGYKLVLEEDTGEWFLITMSNGTNKTECSRIQIRDVNQVNDLITSNQTTPESIIMQNEPVEDLNIKVQMSVFFNPQTFELIKQHEEKDIETKPNLSNQISISQELEKLNENLNLTNIEEPFSNLDDNLLNEEWINNILTTQPTVDFGEQVINNDKMLFSLNQNISADQNQTYVLSSPGLLNNSDLSLENNSSQFEVMLDQAILNHEQSESIKNYIPKEMLNASVSNGRSIEELNLNQLLNFVDQNSIFNNISLSSINSSQTSTIKYLVDDEANLEKKEFKKESNEYRENDEVQIISYDNSKSSAINGFIHNHTYLSTEPQDQNSSVYHPYSYKNKLKKMNKNFNESNQSSKHESRDEQLLRENNINLNLSQIVESTADDFNDLLRSLSLTQEQINVAKDIRRRGKNKVAAQICRKRKLDSIGSLKEDVNSLMERKSELLSEYDTIHSEIKEMTIKFDQLYKQAVGKNYDQNDPILLFINNLKEQLNTKEIPNKPNIKSLNGSDMNTSGSYLNDLSEDDFDEDDEDDSISLSEFSDSLSDHNSKLGETIQAKKKFKKL